MMALLKWLVTRFAAVRWILKLLGSLGVLVPIALFLKSIGWPILIVLAVLALPVLFFLFLFGLPIFLVLLAGGAIMGLLFAVLSIGLVVLKIGIFVVLPIYLLWKLAGWMFGRRRRPATDDSMPRPINEE